MSGEGVMANAPSGPRRTLFERMADLARQQQPDGFKEGRADCDDCLQGDAGPRCTMNCSPGVTLGQHQP